MCLSSKARVYEIMIGITHGLHFARDSVHAQRQTQDTTAFYSFLLKGPGVENTHANTASKHKTLPYSYFLLTGPGVAGTALLAALVNFDTTRVSARFSDFSFSFSDFNFCSCCKTLNYSKAKNISIFAIPSLHVSFSKPAYFSERKTPM